MGFGFGKKGRDQLRGGVGRADKMRIKRLGKGIEAIDKPIREVGESFRGSSGMQGRVGKEVMPIDKKKRNIFDPLS